MRQGKGLKESDRLKKEGRKGESGKGNTARWEGGKEDL